MQTYARRLEALEARCQKLEGEAAKVEEVRRVEADGKALYVSGTCNTVVLTDSAYPADGHRSYTSPRYTSERNQPVDHGPEAGDVGTRRRHKAALGRASSYHQDFMKRPHYRTSDDPNNTGSPACRCKANARTASRCHASCSTITHGLAGPPSPTARAARSGPDGRHVL